MKNGFLKKNDKFLFLLDILYILEEYLRYTSSIFSIILYIFIIIYIIEYP